ncbi:MAG TPA: M28 family peptidase [Candidatus Tumulicola sp.]|jgi:N-acetylated-alpha-linked acidic dipeptidase
MKARIFVAGAIALACIAATAPTEQSNEAAFLRVPSAAGARASSQTINEVNHYAGTPGDYRMAVYMRDTMHRYGLKAWLETFPATVYTPRVLQLQLLTSPAVTFDLHEQKIPVDPDGSRPDAGLPFNAGSGNGDVRAPAVYVSRGLEADYATLARAGVAVRGRIALIRYGAEYRGNLAARAQAHGAAGVIFYTDPKDDGYGKGRVYPNGPYRPLRVVQRGDVMGDGHRALPIPTLPVTGITASRLLADMTGARGPAGWAGALHERYVVGATRAPVRLHVEMNARHTTLWNTVGEVTGADPAQMVVLGGHRDAWVYGVTDNGSGISMLLEVARGFGALHKQGWTPKRSIRIAGWDAEEIGELGSEAYVTAHKTELQKGCVAYINSDEDASGPTFGATAAGALAPTIGPAVREVLRIANPKIDPPSGGSDFEAFVYTIGTPIIDIGYAGPLGTYHSPYDDFRFASMFADPGFVHHRTLAQTMGLIALRLADSPALPYRFTPYVAGLDSGTQMLAKAAEAAHVTLAASLPAAIARFAAAARAYDAAPPAGANALQAAQTLDLLAYSANGYASVAFPAIATAIGSHAQSTVDAAVAKTASQLDDVTALLTHAP